MYPDTYEIVQIKGKDLTVYFYKNGAIASVCGWRSRDGGRSRHLYDLWNPTRGEPRGLAKAAIEKLKSAKAAAPAETTGSDSPQ